VALKMTDPLDELIAALNPEQIDDNTFVGQTPSTSLKRVFGGQVFAQAMRASQKTVEENRQIHSQHGYFIRPGDPNLPIIYSIDRVRDGKSFSTRSASATQNNKVIFSCQMSYQIPENGYEYQKPMPECKGPEECENDNERWRKASESLNPDNQMKSKLHRAKLRSIEMRSVDPIDFINPKPRRPEQLIWVKTSKHIPDCSGQHMHQAILAFLSDFNIMSTSLIPHGISILNKKLQPASLDHAIWFHDKFKVDDWLLYQLDSPRTSSSRGLNRGSFFSLDGRLVASTVQEGLIRIRE
tara:strand:+ start:222 stop:1112 length:891 start_codon:yes stop_codon:yes gene_type:complete